MCGCFFFFKQKTAYEMRISDWSSDVCSSDLVVQFTAVGGKHSADNAAATGQFVVNIATESMMDQVNATSAGFAEDVNEFTAVGVARSEERRVGKACVSTCRSRWWPYH